MAVKGIKVMIKGTSTYKIVRPAPKKAVKKKR